jgi:hypothetical protein
MRWQFAASIAAVATCGCNIVFGVEPGDPAPEQTLPPVDGPAIFVSTDELREVKKRVDAGDEPWASAYASFEADVASKVDSFVARSVVDNGPGADQTDPNVFATDSSTMNCVATPTDARHDYCAALAMSAVARDLAIAWVMTGEAGYAERSIELLHHWFVADETRVLPSATNGGPQSSGGSPGSAIEIPLWVAPFCYAASFLKQHPHWTTLSDDAEARFEEWIQTWLAAATASPPSAGNGSRYLYHLVAVGAAQALLEQPVDSTLAAWKAFMSDAIAPDGVVVGSSDVATAWFHMKAMTLTAQLSTYHGDDLYDFSDATGPALRRAFDTYAPCAGGGAACPSAETLDSVQLAEGASIYELSYKRYQDATHLDVINEHGRPIFDIRVLGNTTLTHGAQ